jgi:formylmethanofuran dehydrogenase subunit E
MDAHTHSHCRFYNIEPEFSVRDLAAFHGHLGPYIVLGYRIGKHVRERFCNDPFRMEAKVYCSGTPPESCLADGVQLGSGCTLGKRNIEIVVSGEVRCTFSTGGKTLVVTPRKFPLPGKNAEPDYEAAIEEIAEHMYDLPDNDLFETSLQA